MVAEGGLLSRAAAVVLWFAAALLAPAPALAQITWDLANEYPASSLPGEGDQFFAARVAELTQGRLNVRLHFDASLGYKTRDQLKAVQEGKVALADSFAGALGDADPVFLVSSLPFLTATVADARALFDATRDRYDRVLARYGQKLLFVSPWPPSGLWSIRPIPDGAALADLRVRTYDETGSKVLTALGARAANISFADAIPKIKAGELDAVLSSGDGGAGRRLWEQLPYFTEINYAVPLSLVTVNLDAWNALDDGLRRAVQTAADETQARQWQAMAGRVEANYARMRANGMTIAIRLDPALRAALDRAGGVAVEEWLVRAGPDGRALLDTYRRQVPR